MFDHFGKKKIIYTAGTYEKWAARNMLPLPGIPVL